MASCRSCAQELADGLDGYHPQCLRNLFGTPILPRLDLDLTTLRGLAADMAGQMSISGVQEKVSVRFNHGALEVASRGGTHILKPPSTSYAALPENEHISMRLASVVGIEIPPCALITLRDGTPAYLVKRFDRLPDHAKLAQEDFCQLAERPASQKYDSSAEECVRVLRRYASEPTIEVFDLFQRLLFAWTIGNGDMHLKNFSLLTGGDGLRGLSPAYDLLNTRLVLANDQLALPITGKRDHLTRRTWMDFASYCLLGPRAAERRVQEQIAALPRMIEMVRRCELPAEMRRRYEMIVAENVRKLERA